MNKNKAIEILSKAQVLSVSEQYEFIDDIENAMIYLMHNGDEKTFCKYAAGIVITPKQIYNFINKKKVKKK